MTTRAQRHVQLLADITADANRHANVDPATAMQQADRPRTFAVGERVRYRPGTGTYGFEDALETDGRLSAVVIGFSRTRVRVVISLAKRRKGATVTRCVDAASLRTDGAY